MSQKSQLRRSVQINIVDFHAGIGVQHFGHDFADFGWRVKFTCALAAAFGESSDQVFVALADDVGFDVFQAQALGADGLNQVG